MPCEEISTGVTGHEFLLSISNDLDGSMVPISTTHLLTKKIGILAGKLIVPDDFNTPLPETLLSAFEGS